MSSRLPKAGEYSPGKSVAQLLADNPPQVADEEWDSINEQWEPEPLGSGNNDDDDKEVQLTCWHWFHGHCHSGDACKYAHEFRPTWPIRALKDGADHYCYLPFCPLNANYVHWLEAEREKAEREQEIEDNAHDDPTPEEAYNEGYNQGMKEGYHIGYGKGYDDSCDHFSRKHPEIAWDVDVSEQEETDPMAEFMADKSPSPVPPPPPPAPQPRPQDEIKIPVSKPKVEQEEKEGDGEGKRAAYTPPPRGIYITKRTGSSAVPAEDEGEGSKPREKLVLTFRKKGG